MTRNSRDLYFSPTGQIEDALTGEILGTVEDLPREMVEVEAAPLPRLKGAALGKVREAMEAEPTSEGARVLGRISPKLIAASVQKAKAAAASKGAKPARA